MKVKIIKWGTKPSEALYVKKCKNCATIMVYENEDTYFSMSGDYYITCPVCEEPILIGLFEKKYNPKKHGEIIGEIKLKGDKNDSSN